MRVLTGGLEDFPISGSPKRGAKKEELLGEPCVYNPVFIILPARRHRGLSTLTSQVKCEARRLVYSEPPPADLAEMLLLMPACRNFPSSQQAEDSGEMKWNPHGRLQLCWGCKNRPRRSIFSPVEPEGL